MALKSTQVYLTEAQHAAVVQASERAGVSMAAFLRDLIDRHVVADAPPPTDISDLVGTLSWSRPTDIAVEKDAMIDAAILADFRRH